MGRGGGSRGASRSKAAGGGGGAPTAESAVTKAYYKLSGGASNKRVYLDELRRETPQLSRAEFDATMDRMASSGAVSLFNLDNPLEITKSRAAGAWRTPSGELRHIMYLGGRSG